MNPFSTDKLTELINNPPADIPHNALITPMLIAVASLIIVGIASMFIASLRHGRESRFISGGAFIFAACLLTGIFIIDTHPSQQTSELTASQLNYEQQVSDELTAAFLRGNQLAHTSQPKSPPGLDWRLVRAGLEVYSKPGHGLGVIATPVPVFVMHDDGPQHTNYGPAQRSQLSATFCKLTSFGNSCLTQNQEILQWAHRLVDEVDGKTAYSPTVRLTYWSDTMVGWDYDSYLASYDPATTSINLKPTPSKITKPTHPLER